MQKSTVIKASLVLSILGVYVYQFISVRRFIQTLEAGHDALIEAPLVSQELQSWMDYVEKYPNATDDPKIKRAVELLDRLDNEE